MNPGDLPCHERVAAFIRTLSAITGDGPVVYGAQVVIAALVLPESNEPARASLARTLQSEHDSVCPDPGCLITQGRAFIEALQEWAL